jgi:hypothetical protein
MRFFRSRGKKGYLGLFAERMRMKRYEAGGWFEEYGRSEKLHLSDISLPDLKKFFDEDMHHQFESFK